MTPERPLPYDGDFASPEEYVDKLLEFATTSQIFQILCGGVHVLDFFTTEPTLFHTVLPEDWRPFLLSCDIMRLLDFLLTDDLDNLHFEDGLSPPESFLEYVRSVRSFSLRRTYAPKTSGLPKLPGTVSVGMSPKKIHEVANFAGYVDRLADDVAAEGGPRISHFVDFGSGQNYLGRALASEPYNRHVVAVEGREVNVSGAKGLDTRSGLAVKPKLRRNKKLWTKILEVAGPEGRSDPETLERAIREVAGDGAFDFKPGMAYGTEYTVEEGKGSVQYISSKLDSGDLADVVSEVRRTPEEEKQAEEQQQQQRARDLQLMAVSIHSCGNLSHYGIRSLVLNPAIRAVAIVGCCYNLMTERLGPPTFKHPCLRPTLQAVNGRAFRESARRDPQGFPMSDRFAAHRGDGVRLNITARMMACQAPRNWGQAESQGFFQRHFLRAVLQKIFLDRGVVGRVRHDGEGPDAGDGAAAASAAEADPFASSTNPVIIGSLPKNCYGTLTAYVRAAVDKLSRFADDKACAELMRERMGNLTDEEMAGYEAAYGPRRHEVSVLWTLMAFSAVAVESLIVADRWTFLREHSDVVDRAWVETVFDHKESPRNLVVVGVKKDGV